MLQNLLFLVIDEVGMGLFWAVMEVDLIPSSSFIYYNLHSWLDPSALVLGDSFLKTRREKEALGCLGTSPMKHSSFGSFDLLLKMESQ